MMRVAGGLIGAVGAVVVVVVLGGIWGFIVGASPCHGQPFSLGGGLFGALVTGYFLGLPAAIFGMVCGAVVAGGTPPQKRRIPAEFGLEG